MGQKLESITRENLVKEMQCFSGIYDVVRLVDPECTTVMTFQGDELVKAQKEPCFSVWEKQERCQNCISFQACHEKRKMTKFEFRKDEAYYVLSVPYEVVDGNVKTVLALELVNRVSTDFQLQSHGIDQTADLVHAVTLKTYEDVLTGTFNRRYYDEKRYLYDSIQNFPKQFGFIMIDVNHFKQINAEYGHIHGDELLAKIGEVLRRNFRNTDKVIRIGGDEFLIVVRDCNQLFIEKKMMHVKSEISEIRFDWMRDKRPSISIGMAYTDEFLGKKDQIDDLFKQADESMFSDKQTPVPITTDKAILIVDDVAMNRDFFKVELQNKFHLLEAENGQDALVILKNNHVDLIITDIFMDKMNGYEFMKNVRSNPNTKTIPIIAITENSEASQSKAIASGADLFVDRPANEEMLVKSIMQLTGHDHGRRELFDLDFVLDSIPGAVIVGKFVTDIPEIVYCSRGIHNIAGVESEEFCEKMKEEGNAYIFPADRQKFEECIHRIVRTRSRGEIIFRSYQNDGSIIWLWMQGRYIGEEDGCPIVEEIILDVSNSTNMYESILDEASSLITVIDEETYEVLYANKKSHDVIGNSTNVNCYELFYGKEKPCESCEMHVCSPNAMKDVMEHKGRSYRQIFKKISWNGRKALLKCMEDISEEKRLQYYIEKEKDSLKQIVQNVPAGLFVFRIESDHKIDLVEANPSACNLMGIDFNKTLGSGVKEVFELTHPEDRALMQNVIHKMGIPGTTVPYEYRQYNKKKEEYRWLSARAHSVLQSDGVVNAYISYFDITERKRAQKLQEDLRIAKMESQAKTDFMSNMSHDMRTPLNGILGLSHLMLEKDNIDELHDDAKQLIVSGKMLLNLINDTLDMNRIEAGKLKLNMKPMDSSIVFQNIMSTVGLLSEQSGISIQYDLPDIPKEQWIPVVSDSSRVEQILINIISNAIKFSKPGGSVELHMKTLSITEDKVVDQYQIIDHGIGMSEEFMKHIFEPFVQEGRMNTSRTQGSGLGLAIVKQLVNLLGSTIEIESKENEGTTVTLCMHYDIYKEDDFSLEETKKETVHLQGMHVLVCEDHPINQRIVIQLLKKQGIEVDTADNGKIGLEMFEQSPLGYYQTILMDVRMPVMDGITATKAIRQLEREDAGTIPILAMTANAFAEDKEATKKAGMNEHLAKPVEPEFLYQILDKYYNQ